MPNPSLPTPTTNLANILSKPALPIPTANPANPANLPSKPATTRPNAQRNRNRRGKKERQRLAREEAERKWGKVATSQLTMADAIEMSQKRAREMGWSDMGEKKLQEWREKGIGPYGDQGEKMDVDVDVDCKPEGKEDVKGLWCCFVQKRDSLLASSTLCAHPPTGEALARVQAGKEGAKGITSAHPLTGEALSQLEARPAMPGLDELLRNRRPAAGPPRMMRSNIMSILNNTDKESLHTHTILKGIAGYTGPDSHMGERAAMDHSQRKAKFWIFERKNGIQLHVNRGSFKMKKSDLVQSRRSRRCRLTLGWNASQCFPNKIDVSQTDCEIFLQYTRLEIAE
ncbi:MAG: hypothetical protein L6R37_007183 [Teloschistes peruensis]|nr:MAG: hypothetical protein L6R37_007183 [Teloschistes peruensis]